MHSLLRMCVYTHTHTHTHTPALFDCCSFGQSCCSRGIDIVCNSWSESSVVITDTINKRTKQYHHIHEEGHQMT